ncbi:MAG TPA: ribose-phosphate pyrophosphokinase [Burkholderiaceae bacterium]
MSPHPLQLFALNHSRQFGEAVAEGLGLPLGAHEEREFEDGEHKSRPLESVRDRDVYVLHALYGQAGQSANDKLCRLLFFLGAVKDAGAARVTAVVPYLAYARKDRRSKPRDPVTTRYVAAMFEAVGTDAILTMDVHNPAAYENAFRCRTEHLEANPLLAESIARALPGKALTVVAPDAGGIKRAGQFRERLEKLAGAPVAAAFAEKHRSEGVLSGSLLVGDVAGRHAVIVDDLISSGSTLVRTARACRERGASGVWAVATHAPFAADAPSVLADKALDRIIVADTVSSPRLRDPAIAEKIGVVDSAPLFAQAIQRLHGGGSITGLLAF